MIFITGGAGFIGANFVLDWLAGSQEPVLNLDKLTCAALADSRLGLIDVSGLAGKHGNLRIYWRIYCKVFRRQYEGNPDCQAVQERQ